MAPALVDLFYSDIEVGTSVTISEVGPATAYLQHERPLPVGSALKVITDEGSELAAVVVRVCETSVESGPGPGMHIQVLDLGESAQKWWASVKEVEEDPLFPEQAVSGSSLGKAPGSTSRTETVDISVDELARMAAEDRTETSAAVPAPGPPPTDESAPNGPISPTDLAASATGKNKPKSEINTTVKMTADQVKAITDLAPADKRNGTSTGMAVATPPPHVAAPKKKRKRGKKKKG